MVTFIVASLFQSVFDHHAVMLSRIVCWDKCANILSTCRNIVQVVMISLVLLFDNYEVLQLVDCM